MNEIQGEERFQEVHRSDFTSIFAILDKPFTCVFTFGTGRMLPMIQRFISGIES